MFRLKSWEAVCLQLLKARQKACWLGLRESTIKAVNAPENAAEETLLPKRGVLLFALKPAEHQADHRILEWFGLEGTLKTIWFQPPCHEQGHLPPAQGAQSSIQPGLEHCQGGGSHSFSGQPGPGPHYPHGEEFLPNL